MIGSRTWRRRFAVPAAVALSLGAVASATVLSAYVMPGIDAYLRELERALAAWGYARAPLIMQINGGCAAVAEILRRPVMALASGPAAAPAAAAFHARAPATSDLISVDMGGTSFDVCLVRDGRAGMSRTIQVEDQPIAKAPVKADRVADAPESVHVEEGLDGEIGSRPVRGLDADPIPEACVVGPAGLDEPLEQASSIDLNAAVPDFALNSTERPVCG